MRFSIVSEEYTYFCCRHLSEPRDEWTTLMLRAGEENIQATEVVVLFC